MKILTLYAIMVLQTTPIYSTGDYQLLLLHTNDMRGALQSTLDENGVSIGGYPRISSIVKEAREKALNRSSPPVLYLDAGDVYTERIWRKPLTRRILMEFINLLNPDAATPGCHNFHGDAETFKEFLGKIKSPLVASNIHFHGGSYVQGKIKPHLVLDVGKKKIGIVGYITPKPHFPLFFKNDTSILIEDELPAVRRECSILKREKRVDLIIGLGHAGLATDKIIAREIDDIDLIIGGYSYNLHWNGPKPGDEVVKGPYPVVVISKAGKKIPIFHTYGFTKYLGRILLNLDENNIVNDYLADPIYLDRRIDEDLSMLAMLDTYSPTLRNVHLPLAQCIVPLDGDNVRNAESNLANSITDAFVHHMSRRYQKRRLYLDDYWTNAPVAIMNAGAIRGKIYTSRKEPNITIRKIQEILPYPQHLVYLTMQGSYVVDTLENGVRSNGETARGEFLQYSGLRVIFDVNREAGDRVLDVRIRCEKCAQPTFGRLEPTNTYNMLVTGFIANGGDGHTTFKSSGIVHEILDEFDQDLFTDYLETVGKIRPEVDERLLLMTSVERRYLPEKQSSGTGINSGSLNVAFLAVIYFVL